MRKKILMSIALMCLGGLGWFVGGNLSGGAVNNVSADIIQIPEIIDTIIDYGEIVIGGPGAIIPVVVGEIIEDNTGDLLDGGGSGGGSNSGSSGSSSSGGSSSDGGGEINCDEMVKELAKDEGGKIKQQWMLCPGMEGAVYTASWLDKVTEGMLTVQTSMYDGNSDTHQIWGKIRDITNYIMAAFLLVIVFSQLTGWGIDNYGIKKMLPRLIVMAIVVNLSFYVCEIAVDLSNILGVGLRDLFGSLGNGQADDPTSIHFMDVIMGYSTVLGIGGGSGVAAGVTAAGLGAGAGLALVIALIVVAVLVIIAVIILLAMLGLRIVIIIACIVLAPLAFAAFILPNTQGLFKKWWGLFKAALVIFPLCGAMAGISVMFKQMTIESSAWSQNIGIMLIMLILPYAGFFLLPMLLKNALAALGKLGGAISNIGDTIRNGGKAVTQGAMKVAQGTEGYKRMQEQAAKRRQLNWASGVMNRYGRGENIAQKIEEARAVIRDPNATDKDKRKARKDLASLQKKALLVNDAAQLQYKNKLEQQMADLGGVPLADDNTIRERALSAQETAEFKNITDQYANASPEEIERALTRAENNYKLPDGRNSTNATKLRAMQSLALGKGLNARVWRGLGGLGLNHGNMYDQKVLSNINYDNLYSTLTGNELLDEFNFAVNDFNTDPNDSNTRRLQSVITALDKRKMVKKSVLERLNNIGFTNGVNHLKLLDTMTRTDSKLLSRAGKDIANNASSTPILFKDYVSGASAVKLGDAVLEKGENAALDYNDDELEYLMDNSGKEVFTYEQLLNGAMKTTDGEQLTQFNRLIAANVGNTKNHKINVADIPRVRLSTFKAMNPSAYRDAVASLKASQATETGRQILNAIDPDVKTFLGLPPV